MARTVRAADDGETDEAADIEFFSTTATLAEDLEVAAPGDPMAACIPTFPSCTLALLLASSAAEIWGFAFPRSWAAPLLLGCSAVEISVRLGAMAGDMVEGRTAGPAKDEAAVLVRGGLVGGAASALTDDKGADDEDNGGAGAKAGFEEAPFGSETRVDRVVAEEGVTAAGVVLLGGERA